MRHWILTAALLTTSCIWAQEKALTSTGETVILYDDGTWVYEDTGNLPNAFNIPTNPAVFKKDRNAVFELKSKKTDFAFHIDPRYWTFEKASNNAEAEYELKLRDEDMYGVIIAEQIPIPLETLRGIALDNGKSVAPDLHIVNEEYRNVNGIKVLHLQMDGTMQGIKFSYFGYYATNESGTVQFITYTSTNLLGKYKFEAEKLLNGLELQ